MRRSPRRQGFVLLMTLFVLAIVGLLLISLANHSMVAATDAVSLRKETEQKWAQASCQRFVLNNLDNLLSQEGEDGKRIPLAQAQLGFVLNDTAFDILVEDESSKLGVNFLFENAGRMKASQIIREYTSTDSKLIVDLSPQESEDTTVVNDVFEGWGQVFSIPSTKARESSSLIFNATRELTCWSKRINIKTAEDHVLRDAVELVAGGGIASQLIDARSSNPSSSLSEMIQATGASERQIQELGGILSDRSWCQSITIQSRGSSYNRTTQIFRKYYTPTVYRIQSYRW
jgi:type II secretory pathway pseudopilin PulG